MKTPTETTAVVSMPTDRNALLEALIDAVPHIAWVTEADGSMAYINARWREYTGVDGMNRDRILECIHPDDVDHVLKAMSLSRQSGQFHPYELRLLRHDGAYRWHRVRASVLADEEGQPKRWIGTSTDVHEEVLAMQALRETEDHRRFRLEASPQIPWLANPQGEIIEFGPQWLALTGMSEKEALVSQISVLHPEDMEGMIAGWRACLVSGNPFEYEHRIRVADGGYLWVRSSAVARRSDRGEIMAWYGTTEVIDERKRAVQELRLTQDSLALAMKGGRMGWWVRDLASNRVSWSPELEQLFGLRPGAFIGTEDDFLDFVLPEDRHLVHDAVSEAVDLHTDYSVEFRFRAVDGRLGWMEGRGQATYDAAGKPLSIYGIGIDITERKQAEEAVQSSERRLRTLVEQSPIAIQTFAPDGSVISANAAWESLWEAKLGDLNGYNILQDAQLEALGIMPRIRKAFSGEPQRLPAVLYDPEKGGQQGRRRFVEGRVFPVYERVGELLEVVLLLEDVTGQTETFEALRQSEERFRTIAETVPHFIWAATPDGANDYLNPQFLDYLGSSEAEMMGTAWVDHLHPDDRDGAADAWTKAVESGKSHTSEYRIRAADGSYRWFQSRGVPVRDSAGEIIRWYGIITDIQSQRDQAETLERLVRERTSELQLAYQEQESFSYSVSHDLRAPLRAIIATVRMLEQDFASELTEDAHALLTRQARAANKLAALIDDLLELSRVGRWELDSTSVDLTTIFANVAEGLEACQRSRIEIGPNLIAVGDPQLLQSVAQNLLENAVKFSPGGGLIRVGRDLEAKDRPFFVSDSGVGFSMEFAHKLFQPFHRLHRDDEFEGTGIGLATVRRILERHGGRIWVRSEPGRGATFYFTLSEGS